MAIEMGLTMAVSRGHAVYVVAVSGGFRAVLFCDECPLSVVAVVGVSGVVWSA